jgi:hypothetical protein
LDRKTMLMESLTLFEDAPIPMDRFISRVQNLIMNISRKGYRSVFFRANLDDKDNLVDIDVIADLQSGKKEHITTIRDVFRGETIEGSVNRVDAAIKLADQFLPVFRRVKLQGMTRSTRMYFCYADTTRGLNLKTNKWEKVEQ